MKIEHINVLKSDIPSACTESAAARLVGLFTEKGLMLASAESCTGGLFGGAVTAVSGASAIYLGGVISYMDDVKMTMLGVGEKTLGEHTAVSAETACEMARGAMVRLGADFGVSVTGYAGPSGGDEKNPVGTVFVCVSDKNCDSVVRLSFEIGCTREEIRRYSVYFMLIRTAMKVEM